MTHASMVLFKAVSGYLDLNSQTNFLLSGLLLTVVLCGVAGSDSKHNALSGGQCPAGQGKPDPRHCAPFCVLAAPLPSFWKSLGTVQCS